MEIKITETGLSEAQAFLNGLLSRSNDMTPAMEAAGTVAQSSVVENFKQGGRPEPWTPLADSTLYGYSRMRTVKGNLTAKARRVKAGHAQILVGSPPHLMKSIDFQARPKEVEVGVKGLPYAAIHQFGGMTGRGHKTRIPARPYLVLQPEDTERIKKIMINWLGEGAYNLMETSSILGAMQTL